MGLFGWGAVKERPNIIVILLDQFRNDARQHLRIFDGLGKRGALFSNMITYAPYTLASLHATFTGMYGMDNGVDGYQRSDRYDKKSCYSLPEYLSAAGYYTHGYTFSPILFPHSGFENLRIVTEDKEVNILESHKKELRDCFQQTRPFFSFLHYGEIHHGIVREVIRKYGDFDPEYFGSWQNNFNRYLEYARKASEYTRELVGLADELDLKKNTLLIITTDHGSGLGEKPGEKAYGIYTYDYSIRIWAYFIYSKLFPAGSEYKIQVRSIDILPTILELLNIKPSKRRKRIKGESLFKIIRGKESDDRLAFSETGGVEGPHPSPDRANVKCVRDGKWKLIYNTTTNKVELYDIVADPEETDNLAVKNSQKRDDLWLKMVGYL